MNLLFWHYLISSSSLYCESNTRSLNCLDREFHGTPSAYRLVHCRVMSQIRVTSIRDLRTAFEVSSWNFGKPSSVLESAGGSICGRRRVVCFVAFHEFVPFVMHSGKHPFQYWCKFYVMLSVLRVQREKKFQAEPPKGKPGVLLFCLMSSKRRYKFAGSVNSLQYPTPYPIALDISLRHLYEKFLLA